MREDHLKAALARTHASRRDVLTWGLAATSLLVLPGLAACASNSTPAQPTNTPLPSPSHPDKVANAEEASALVLALAQYAASAGSYGIAGALIDNESGIVIQAIPNRVVQRLDADVAQAPGEAFTYDPTAHGERQLASWYFANKKAESLPEANKLTVVTTLDPCAMCSGTLLEAGFNVATVAPDTFSGIDYNQKFNFTTLPEPLRSQAKSRFGYYGVDGGRAYVGGPAVLFRKTTITQDTFTGCEAVYQNNAGNVRSSRKGTGTTPDQLKNPATLNTAEPIRIALKQQYRGAFSLTLANFRQPDAELKSVLTKLRNETPGAKNAVAFIDPFGNLISAAADTFAISPVATAFMNVVQSYSKTRFDLVNTKAISDIARETLTSPKYGTFVWLYAPSPTEATTIEELGAYGSTVEAALPQTSPSSFQFYEPPLSGTISQLREVIKNLPPLYSQLIKISPEQVKL